MVTLDSVHRKYGLNADAKPADVATLPDGTKLSFAALSRAVEVREYKPPRASLEEALAALLKAQDHPLLEDDLSSTVESVAQAVVDPSSGLSPDKVNDPDYMAAWVARLAHTGSTAEATAYADAVSAVSMSADAAVVLASQLTMKEITDPAFMKALASAVQGIVWNPDSDPEGTLFKQQVGEQLLALRSDVAYPQ